MKKSATKEHQNQCRQEQDIPFHIRGIASLELTSKYYDKKNNKSKIQLFLYINLRKTYFANLLDIISNHDGTGRLRDRGGAAGPGASRASLRPQEHPHHQERITYFDFLQQIEWILISFI